MQGATSPSAAASTICLGIALARLEGVIASNALLKRWPEMRLAGEPERRQTYTLRGLQTLPVSISPRQ
jgi:cytochrome P450